MEGEWSRTILGEHVELATGEAFKSDLFGTSPACGILLARGDNVKEGQFEWGEKARYWPEMTPALERYLLNEGDVLLGMDGSKVGKNWVKVRQKDLPCLLVQRVARLRAKQTMDQEFLRYIIGNPQFREYIGRVCTGTSIPHISGGQIKSYEITLPPLPTQRAIASVLGTLDDLIELNRETNEILEEMARALFKSWFVDFDPVRAKLEGRPPAGMDAATAALFPDHFQDSELGQIPKGWVTKPLPDVVEVNPRRTLKAGCLAPYLDMKNLPTRGHCADEVIDRVFTSGTKFQNGDTLLARITPCLENGKTGYVDFLENGQVGWGSTEYIVLTPKAPFPPQFGYLLARSDALRSHAIQNMTGTSGRQRVPSECFDTFLLAIPPIPDVARRFGEITAPLMETIKANAEESRDLATLRDTLLPKLLSGEVSVANAGLSPETV